jgi:hypothetical protein
MNFIDIMQKQYDAHTYHCGHFVCDYWRLLTGEDIASELAGILVPLDMASVPRVSLKGIRRLRLPRSPCIAVLTSRLQQRHLGVYNFGKIIHLQEDYPECVQVSIAMRYFNRIRYYVPKED